LAQLDDVCNFPKGTDEKLLQKLQEAFMQHAHFTMGGQNEFVIKHYAGDVCSCKISLTEREREIDWLVGYLLDN
jgi:myosin heavy subunit